MRRNDIDIFLNTEEQFKRILNQCISNKNDYYHFGFGDWA